MGIWVYSLTNCDINQNYKNIIFFMHITIVINKCLERKKPNYVIKNIK